MVKVFTFNKVSDPTEIFYAEPNELPNVRISAGGIKVLSGGSWSKVQPYVDRPATAGKATSGFAMPYRNGLVMNIDDGSNGMIVQLDNRGFILFRCLRGTVTVPLIDGYNYEHNGTLSNSTITLSAGQYALFYKTYKPALGTYLTSDVESGTGLKINVTTIDGSSFVMYANIGHGEANFNPTSYDTVDSFFKYADGSYRPPCLPVMVNAWRNRNTQQHACIIKLRPYLMNPYLDDPNTGTNQLLDNVPRSLYVGDNGTSFYFAFEYDMHDTSREHRFTVRWVVEYSYDPGNDVWKVRVFTKLHAVTDIYNYDEGGVTVGYGILVHIGTFYEDENHDISDSYYGFKASTGEWESLVFSGYTWRTGYRAVRINASAYGKQVYIYAKYIAKGGSLSLTTYKHGRDTVHALLDMYYADFADKTIPQGSITAFGVEMWYARSDVYEDPVPAEADYGSDTSFVDQYFQEKIPTQITLTITPL